jgi:lipooligosaccharide transport system ATP-binding protein
VLQVLQLEEKADAWVGKLSGGQRQRLAVATALVGSPRVLFLDEPTTGLDPQSRRQLWDIIRSFQKNGGTVLLTTHYMDEAEQLCDRLVVMDKGKIAAEGSPRELIARYSTREVVELRLPADERPEEVASRLDGLVRRLEALPDRLLLYSDDGDATASRVHDLGLQPESVLVRRSTLEDVFLHLTGRTLVDD